MWSQQVRSTLAENLKQRGRVKEGKEGATGADGARMQPLLETTEKGTLEEKWSLQIQRLPPPLAHLVPAPEAAQSRSPNAALRSGSKT